MWVVVHTYVGFALAAVLHLPFWQMVLVVLASHVLLDLVPHWDYTGDRARLLWASVDLFAALATGVALLVWGMPFSVVALGAISGAPDLDVVGSALWGHESRHLFPSHWRHFPHGRCGPALGIPLQLGIVAACGAVFLAVGRSFSDDPGPVGSRARWPDRERASGAPLRCTASAGRRRCRASRAR